MPILKSLKKHKILLDTHVWIWIANGESSSLSRGFIDFFEYACNSQLVFISPLSIWEVGMLESKGRIELDMDVFDWTERALYECLIEICPITPRIALQSSRIEDFHGDPVDRILVASSHETGAVLVTCDKKISQFGAGKFLSVFDPS